MKKLLSITLLLGLAGWLTAMAPGAGFAAAEKKTPPPGGEFGANHSPNNTADHSKFKELQQTFKSGPEVTRACLTCHTEAASQVHRTLHWTWYSKGPSGTELGKRSHTVNNFCITLASNEPRCTSCHIGYGWKDANFDFTAQDKVDCLVCHEQTGTYKKFPTKAGHVVDEPTEFGGKTWEPPDLAAAARSVALPTRKNCGECHFFGGGGEGVKHGDLDSSLYKPEKELDVHMNSEGLNFTCQRCHSTEKHEIAGRSYESNGVHEKENLLENDQVKRITCTSCHSETPHKKDSWANRHTAKVACQTCHIPAFARKNSTKMYWDWSTAGKRDEAGRPIVIQKDGRPAYDGMKGDFVWQKDVVPEYGWYDGHFKYLTLDDKIDPLKPVRINTAQGSPSDPDSKIYPFKVHRGKQPYDPVNSRFIAPHLFGKDDNAYWKNYDWKKAAEAGMSNLNLPFSGEVGFVESEYLFQTTHMVAPKGKALSCAQCHSSNGRLKDIGGVYLPGRDSNSGVDKLGWLGIVSAAFGVTGHGLTRFVRNKRRS